MNSTLLLVSAVVFLGIVCPALSDERNWDGRIVRTITRNFRTTKPRISGSFKLSGPLGGQIKGSIDGSIGRTGGYSRGIQGALDTSFDSRAPLGGSKFSRKSSHGGFLKSGLDGIGVGVSSRIDRTMQGPYGERISRGYDTGVSGTLNVLPIVSDRLVSINGGLCGFLPPACRGVIPEANTMCLYTFDIDLGRCVKANVFATCINQGYDNMFQTEAECVAHCSQGIVLPATTY